MWLAASFYLYRFHGAIVYQNLKMCFLHKLCLALEFNCCFNSITYTH